MLAVPALACFPGAPIYAMPTLPHSATPPAAPAAPAAAGRDSVASPRARRVLVADLLALTILGLAVATPWRGHFAKPHNDFYEFRETGRALLEGRLPESFKRAPLYCVLIAAGGSLVAATGWSETPDLDAAQWLCALLLPVNLVLTYLVARPWLGGAARWPAVLFALCPVGVYCTSHAIAEPLLIATILLTVLLAQRGSPLAWIAALLACSTRYDAAGLVPGLVIAARLAGRPWRHVAAGALLSLSVPAVWLALTLAHWQPAADDHYLTQIRERPQFDLLWSLTVPAEALFSPDRLRMAAPFDQIEPWIRTGLPLAAGLLAAAGLVRLLVRRDAGAVVAAAAWLGYTLVHAVFPFRFPRFGYPPAALLLVFAGAGLQAVCAFAVQRAGRRFSPFAWAVAAVLVAAWFASGELGSLPLLIGTPAQREVALLLGVGLAAVLAWSAGCAASRRGMLRIAGLLVLLMLARVQVRETVALMGTGRELANLVRAARWVRDQTQPDVLLASSEPGLYRLYAGLAPGGRFVGFEQIAADDWPAVLAECRARGIRFLVWHDQQFGEHGEYYSRKWRLARFDALAQPGAVEGVRLVQRFAGSPNVYVFELPP